MFLLISVCLCGCNENNITDDDSNNETNGDNGTRFYGKWLEEAENEGMNLTMRHTFSSNGTYTFEILDNDHSDTGTWELVDGNLTTITSRITIYSYSFSDNDTTLTLTDITTEDKSILLKQ